MFRTIASAALTFTIAVFALRHSPLGSPLAEPLLLLFMGALFLLVGRLFEPRRKAEPAAELAERRAA